MSTTQHEFFASVPRNLESLAATELHALGASDVKAVASGVQFRGSLSIGYRACLWSRVANRILLPLHAAPARSPEQLYSVIQAIDWSLHVRETQTLAVDFFCAKSEITHSHYGALKVKDAIVDQFRERTGQRPSVDRVRPDIRVNVYLFRNRARVSIDLSGESLHRRGYRPANAAAPLKENLAAALLLAAQWEPDTESIVDPMCGSGTLLVEAAMIASDRAPCLSRDYFGFLGWQQHDESLWQSLLAEAQQRFEAGLEAMPVIHGQDKSAQAIDAATASVQAAGLSRYISLAVTDIHNVVRPVADHGLVISNPPYGIRVEEQATLGPLYGAIGQMLRRHYGGWRVALLSGAPKLLHRTRLNLDTSLAFDNGGLPVKLALGRVPAVHKGGHKAGVQQEDKDDSAARARAAVNEGGPSSDSAVSDEALSESDASQIDSPWAAAQRRKSASPAPDAMFGNRVSKNLKKFKSWRKREQIQAFRVYDADIPEYSVAVDVYDSLERHLVVQEYRAPATVDPVRAAERLEAVIATLPSVLETSPENVHVKVRQRQKGVGQYEKSGERGVEHIVEEAGCRVLVNFDDYLDTGLFLDHRKVRCYIQQQSRGKRFLNLFGYTGVATAHAIVGGASRTVTVDMSRTYLAWAERNFVLNSVRNERAGRQVADTADSSAHVTHRADCLTWLAGADSEALPYRDEQFDLILLDPPTFSNSSTMNEDWDVQRDHVRVITQAMTLLSADGLLIFSNNYRRFRLDTDALSDYALDDRTTWSIDHDFQRNARIHQCWFIRHGHESP